jgi:hypothetical protein
VIWVSLEELFTLVVRPQAELGVHSLRIAAQRPDVLWPITTLPWERLPQLSEVQINSLSVVIAPLQELHAISLHQLDAAVLLGEAARPDIRPEVAQRLGFANAGEGIAKDGPHQIEETPCRAAIVLDPMLQVIQELRVADGQPFSRHGPADGVRR